MSSLAGQLVTGGGLLEERRGRGGLAQLGGTGSNSGLGDVAVRSVTVLARLVTSRRAILRSGGQPAKMSGVSCLPSRNWSPIALRNAKGPR